MMTLREAAARLGLASGTLRWQIRNGRLQARKIGRDWLVTQAEVDRYARDHRRAPKRVAGVRGSE